MEKNGEKVLCSTECAKSDSEEMLLYKHYCNAAQVTVKNIRVQ